MYNVNDVLLWKPNLRNNNTASDDFGVVVTVKSISPVFGRDVYTIAALGGTGTVRVNSDSLQEIPPDQHQSFYEVTT